MGFSQSTTESAARMHPRRQHHRAATELLVRSYGASGDSLWLWSGRQNKTFRPDKMTATKGAQGRRSIELAISQDSYKQLPPLQRGREDDAVPILYLGGGRRPLYHRALKREVEPFFCSSSS